MKVLYNEDLANRISIESCGYVGNHTAFWLVLLTGKNASGPGSSEITSFRVPTSCTVKEGHTKEGAAKEKFSTVGSNHFWEVRQQHST